jgi:hypothetical protein
MKMPNERIRDLAKVLVVIGAAALINPDSPSIHGGGLGSLFLFGEELCRFRE